MKIQTKHETFGKFACLLLSYCEVCGIDPDKVFDDFDSLVDKGILDSECTVKQPDKLITLYTGKSVKVKGSESNPKAGKQIARFRNVKRWGPLNKANDDGHGHWVVVDDSDTVVWNSLDHSDNVDNGVPVDYRYVVAL